MTTNNNNTPGKIKHTNELRSHGGGAATIGWFTTEGRLLQANHTTTTTTTTKSSTRKRNRNHKRTRRRGKGNANKNNNNNKPERQEIHVNPALEQAAVSITPDATIKQQQDPSELTLTNLPPPTAFPSYAELLSLPNDFLIQFAKNRSEMQVFLAIGHAATKLDTILKWLKVKTHQISVIDIASHTITTVSIPTQYSRHISSQTTPAYLPTLPILAQLRTNLLEQINSLKTTLQTILAELTLLSRHATQFIETNKTMAAEFLKNGFTRGAEQRDGVAKIQHHLIERIQYFIQKRNPHLPATQFLAPWKDLIQIYLRNSSQEMVDNADAMEVDVPVEAVKEVVSVGVGVPSQATQIQSQSQSQDEVVESSMKCGMKRRREEDDNDADDEEEVEEQQDEATPDIGTESWLQTSTNNTSMQILSGVTDVSDVVFAVAGTKRRRSGDGSSRVLSQDMQLRKRVREGTATEDEDYDEEYDNDEKLTAMKPTTRKPFDRKYRDLIHPPLLPPTAQTLAKPILAAPISVTTDSQDTIPSSMPVPQSSQSHPFPQKSITAHSTVGEDMIESFSVGEIVDPFGSGIPTGDTVVMTSTQNNPSVKPSTMIFPQSANSSTMLFNTQSDNDSQSSSQRPTRHSDVEHIQASQESLCLDEAGNSVSSLRGLKDDESTVLEYSVEKENSQRSVNG